MAPRPLILSSLLAFALAACGSKSDAPAGDPRPPLWEVRGPTGAVEGWLFGTIHALPKDLAWRSPALDSRLEAADTLVVEVANLGDEAAIGETFQSLAYDRREPPIARRIDARYAPQFDRLLVKAKVRSDYFDRMESWAAGLALAQVAQAGRSENGVDRALIAGFKGDTVELEGARAQLRIFDALPLKEQRDLLNAVLEETADYERDIGELAQVWRAGDLERLETLTDRGILADPELRAALLTARNRAWAIQIENLLSTEAKPFVAVGAGHLLGSEGLPALLGDAGYRVVRVQ